MRFRLGLMTGFTVGYVLGTKAGRERYDQLCALARQVTGSQPAQQLSADMREAATRAGQNIEQKAADQVSRVSNLVRSGEQPPSPAGPS